jgi:hypothetical protein
MNVPRKRLMFKSILAKFRLRAPLSGPAFPRQSATALTRKGIFDILNITLKICWKKRKTL